MGVFWFLLFIRCIGGCPGGPGLGIIFLLAVVTCPALLLGVLPFVGLLVIFFAPIGNALIYGCIAALYKKTKESHLPRSLSITKVPSDLDKSSHKSN